MPSLPQQQTNGLLTEQFDLIDLFDVGMVVMDSDLVLKHINLKAIELLDLPGSDLSKFRTLEDIIRFNARRGEYGEDTGEDAVQNRLKIYSSDESYEYLRERPNGTVLKVVGKRTSDGGYATTFTDVTEIERSRMILANQNKDLLNELGENKLVMNIEQELIQREAEIKDIVLENTHHGISVFDKNLNLVLCNQRFRELLGFPDDLYAPGTNMADMFRFNAERGEYGDVDTEACVREKVELAMRFEPHKFHRTQPDGTVLEIIGRPVSIGFVSTYADVTSQVRIKEALEHAYDRTHAMLEASPAGMGITRIKDGSIQLINTPGAKLLGFADADAAVGFCTKGVNWIHNSERELFLREFQQTQRVTAKEVHLRKITGEEFWCYLSWDHIQYEDEDCILFWMYDITEQRKLHRQLLESEKMASLGGLVAGVAHEINTPIGVGVTAITQLIEQNNQCLDALAGGTLGKNQLEKYLGTSKEAFDIVFNNLQSAAQLIQSFKQVSVDQVSETPREIKLEDYFPKIIQSLKPKIKRSSAEVDLKVESEGCFYTYPGALAQIITNLIQNSIIHGYGDGRTGTITILVSGDPNRGMDICFRDDGKGCDEETLKQLFEPFFTTTRGSGGSGLGLNIVHNLITHKLGGQIVASRPDSGGLQFDIRLPLMEAEPEGNGA